MEGLSVSFLFHLILFLFSMLSQIIFFSYSKVFISFCDKVTYVVNEGKVVDLST